MPQWRKLHAKATESQDINDMPDDFTRLLWVMLPLGLDREGRGLDNPSWVKAKIMPLRLDVTAEMINAAMNFYSERGMVERYESQGRRYFCIPTWSKYQSTEREAESTFPAPPTQEEPKKDNGRSWISEMIRHYESRPGVYVITCTETDKCYVGASLTVKERIRAHLRELENGDNLHPMAADFQKYGRESISIRVYRYAENANQLKEFEQEAINGYSKDDLYNTLDSRWHWKWQETALNERSRVGHASVMQNSRLEESRVDKSREEEEKKEQAADAAPGSSPQENGDKPKPPKTPKKPKPDPLAMVVIPDCLVTDEFMREWGRWITHRKQKRQPLTPLTAEEQLSDLAAVGVDTAIAEIKQSIKRGWLGLFPPKDENDYKRNGTSNQSNQPPQKKYTPADIAALKAKQEAERAAQAQKGQ